MTNKKDGSNSKKAFETAMSRLKSDDMDAQKIQNFCKNAKAGKANLSDEQVEDILELAEKRLREIKPNLANKLFGKKNVNRVQPST